MGRILAIDFGLKRTGIAVTDELQITANGLTTIHSTNLIFFLTGYVKKENVVQFVIGLPKKLNNEKEDLVNEIYIFSNQLIEIFPNIPIEFVDERFTSKMAVRIMIDGGLKKKKRKDRSLIDKISATIILQSYLEQKK